MNYKKSACFMMLTAVMAGLAFSQTAQAQQTWQATLGAQSKDMGKQVVAFLPNEMWIHAGDTINWTSASGDIHTVSFLIAGQTYRDFTVGCPGFSASGTSFNGSACVSAPPLVAGQNFAVKFPKAGNYKLVCMVHTAMTGVIHVLATSATLPHTQAFYNEEAEDQTKSILADADMGDMDMGDHDHGDRDGKRKGMLAARVLPGKNSVVAGIGEMANTAAGFESLSVVRFLGATIEVRVGDTVEWTNLDPALPHTVTFGTEPGNPFPPVNVTMDPDGARHATLNFVGDSAHSGFLVAAPQDQAGVPQSPPGTTVFRVTFTRAGTYKYICALHDNLGMVGKVIVEP
ncbi:MAG: plastocyanin/azurin family copper-binding protein [Acidobacteriota bacterium]|nr:plastocyanin/azurin family copper-binding protein [Acidobacteriota bacterium]